MKKLFLSILAGTLFCSSAWASGYQVALQGNRSTAMGNIGVGLRPDPSGIYFNPGALALMRQNGVQIGANLIYANIAYQPFESNDVYRTDNPVGTPFHAYGVFGAEDSNLKFGLGIYTPYGSSVVWGNNWEGQFNLTRLSLQAIYVQPTISYAISESLSVGAGFIYSFGGVNLQRNIDLPMADGSYSSVELDGKASGFGYNLGVFFAPSESFSLGINYRSRVNMKVEEGDATFNRPSAAAGAIPASTTFGAELPLPSFLTIGAAFRPVEAFTIGLDISRAGWGAYESLRFDYADPVNGQNFTEDERNYETSYTFKIGAEYQVIDALSLRAGTYYDQSPVQDGFLTPETPDSDAMGYTAGFGLNLGESFSADFSILFIDRKQRDNVSKLDGGLSGTYKAQAVSPGLSLTYKF